MSEDPNGAGYPGNLAEALLTCERLQNRLREELGVSPSPMVQSLHRRLLQGQRPGSA